MDSTAMARLSLSPHHPISGWKNRFLASLNHSSTLIIDGPSGSGKSSQIPQWAVEYTRRGGRKGLVACTQPHPLAAVSHSVRVGEEMGEKVGFAIRDETRGASSLTFCTDGWMLREMKISPLLDEYSLIVVDEVNERSLNTDILIGLLKEILTVRRDFKIILMGSSIDSDKWVNYFGCYCPLLKVAPSVSLDIVYSPPSYKSLLDTAVDTVVFLHVTEKNNGGILLFLATKDHVDLVWREIRRRVEGIEFIPLHSDLPLDQLMRVHCPSNGRKCIVSTSIGETSVVFDGISFVVDCEFTETTIYDPVSGCDSPRMTSISKMTAKRRAERAGVRTIRLYSEKEFNAMREEEIPEIVRVNPLRVERLMDDMGMDGFDFIDRPTPTRWGVAKY